MARNNNTRTQLIRDAIASIQNSPKSPSQLVNMTPDSLFYGNDKADDSLANDTMLFGPSSGCTNGALCTGPGMGRLEDDTMLFGPSSGCTNGALCTGPGMGRIDA